MANPLQMACGGEGRGRPAFSSWSSRERRPPTWRLERGGGGTRRPGGWGGEFLVAYVALEVFGPLVHARARTDLLVVQLPAAVKLGRPATAEEVRRLGGE